MVRQIKIARDTAVKARSAAIITLKTLIVNAPGDLRETLEPLTDRKLKDRCAALESEDLINPSGSVKHALRALASRWLMLSTEIGSPDEALDTITMTAVPTLREAFGIGPDSAAEMMIVAGDNPQRVRSEAAFASIHKGISRIQHDESRWLPARRRTGDPAQRSHVVEITDLVDLSRWPAGTRLIVRREHLHQGAQRSLFPSLCYRYWGHYTDNTGNPVELDAHMRDHAHVEDHIKRLKDSGLERFPFRDLDANRAWMQTVCLAADLVRWFQHLCCTGHLATAEPKRLRWTLWHTPARIVRRAGRDVMRIIDGWPTTTDLLDAHRRITAIC